MRSSNTRVWSPPRPAAPTIWKRAEDKARDTPLRIPRFVLDHKEPLHRTTPPLPGGDPMGAVWQI
jgi:hypothetical protein